MDNSPKILILKGIIHPKMKIIHDLLTLKPSQVQSWVDYLQIVIRYSFQITWQKL